MQDLDKIIDYRLKAHAKIAEEEGVDYNLTSEYLKEIMTEYCPITDIKIDWFSGIMNYNNHPRLVRVSYSDGVIEGNVIWISQLGLSIRNRIKAIEGGKWPKK
jgi:hypothetical protein